LTIKIYDIDGSIISDKPYSTSDSKITLDVSDIKNGIYLMEIKSSEQISFKKFIIQK